MQDGVGGPGLSSGPRGHVRIPGPHPPRRKPHEWLGQPRFASPAYGHTPPRGRHLSAFRRPWYIPRLSNSAGTSACLLGPLRCTHRSLALMDGSPQEARLSRRDTSSWALRVRGRLHGRSLHSEVGASSQDRVWSPPPRPARVHRRVRQQVRLRVRRRVHRFCFTRRTPPARGGLGGSAHDRRARPSS